MPPREPIGSWLRPPLPDAALHGLAGDVTRALARTTDADPAALLLTFLAMFGSACGPEPHVEFGGRAEQPARLFVVIVGDAATGRKGTAHEAVESLFAGADPRWSGRIHPGIASAEAMIDRVADGLSDDCRLLVMETEFGRLLEVIARTGTLSMQLRNAYDGRTLQITRKDRARSVTAGHAHISVLGHITPSELIRQHARMRSAGGLESRFLYAYVTVTPREVSPFGAAGLPWDLTDRVRSALDRSRNAVLERTDPISRYLCLRRGVQPSTTMPVAEEVTGGWREVKARLPEVNTDLGTMFGRAETHVIRLALTYALADGSPVVGMEHVDAALALWTYCARSAEVIFGIPVGGLPPSIDPARRARAFVALHRAYPGWLALDTISGRVFGRNRTSDEVKAIMASLVAEGRAEQRQVPTKGRPRTEYRAARTNPVTPYLEEE